MKHAFLVFLGSGLGGVTRHFLNVLIAGVAGSSFSWGILAISVLGSTLIGLAAGWFAFRGEASNDLRMFLTTGILGGFTTFSTLSLDTGLLYERGQPGLAVAYIAASVVLSLIGLFGALWSVRALASLRLRCTALLWHFKYS